MHALSGDKSIDMDLNGHCYLFLDAFNMTDMPAVSCILSSSVSYRDIIKKTLLDRNVCVMFATMMLKCSVQNAVAKVLWMVYRVISKDPRSPRSVSRCDFGLSLLKSLGSFSCRQNLVSLIVWKFNLAFYTTSFQIYVSHRKLCFVYRLWLSCQYTDLWNWSLFNTVLCVTVSLHYFCFVMFNINAV